MRKSMWAIGVIVLVGLIALGASTVSTTKPTVQATATSSSDCSSGQAGTGSATLQKQDNNQRSPQAISGCPAMGDQKTRNKNASGSCCTRKDSSI
ncbi:MAG: hypothetical protein GXO90_10480 [FCB group bacterium]|nr:hypothetical protein [FCB group bacterium]